MNIEIRNAAEHDVPSIVGLMRDFAKYEKLADYCEITEVRLAAAMFGDEGFVEGMVALEGLEPVGYALFYPSFASFRGERGFYLEDIYVDGRHRGSGVGQRMLRRIAQTAKFRGFERIDFQVLDWNTTAIDFYKKLGAICNPDESHFKFSDEAFALLAA